MNRVGGWWWPAYWAMLISGIIPALYFLLTWRPSRLWRLRELDTGGWVFGILLLYLSAAVRTLLSAAPPPTMDVAVVNLVLGFAVGVILWVRALHWHAMRQEFREKPGRRMDDVR